MPPDVPPHLRGMWVPPGGAEPPPLLPAQPPAPSRRGGAVRALVAVCLLVVALVVGGKVVGDRNWTLPWKGDTPSAAPIAPIAPSPPLDFAAVSAIINPTLVNIDVVVGPLEMRGAGTGIVLSSNGQILTCHHVVKGAIEIQVTDVGNGLIYDATVVGYDSTHDVAVLQLVNAVDLATARVGDSSKVRFGDEVLASGNARGAGGTPTSVAGKVTDVDATIVARSQADYSRKYLNGLIEVEATVVPGQSGGSLANSAGEVIGLITAASMTPDPDATPTVEPTPQAAPEPGQGYAVPIKDAMAIADQIRSGQRSDTVHIGPTATLGVVVSDSKSPKFMGAQVEIAVFDSPAYAAGLDTGDVITAIDGKPVDSSTALRAEISARSPDDVVVLDVTDKAGGHRVVRVTLAGGPPN